MPMTKHFKTLRFAIAAAVFALSMPHATALDENGNFESTQEQDEYIALTLKKMATELNSQTPVQLDEDFRMMSVIALEKTINFNMRLVNFGADQVDPSHFEQLIRENLNHTVCRSKATRDLIGLGVQYIYLYSGNDGKLIARIVVDSFRC